MSNFSRKRLTFRPLAAILVSVVAAVVLIGCATWKPDDYDTDGILDIPDFDNYLNMECFPDLFTEYCEEDNENLA